MARKKKNKNKDAKNDPDVNEEGPVPANVTQPSGFDLAAPTSKIPAMHESNSGPQNLFDSKPDAKKPDPRHVADSRSRAEWKGLEPEEDYEPEVGFPAKGVVEDELDMTPMVDVTFLLLIFFMVTASFTLQKSIAQPPVPDEAPSTNYQEQEDEDQYVEILIDQFNTYRLTNKDAEEIEAPSDQEMRTQLRDMVSRTNAKKLKIRVHGDAFHEKMVTAWDAGLDNGIDAIVVTLTEEDL